MDLPAGAIKAQSDAAYARLIAYCVDYYHEHLFNPHWGEQLKFGPDNTLEISMVSQGLDKQQADQVWQPFADWIKASPTDFVMTSPLHSGAVPARTWWDLKDNRSMIQDTREGATAAHAWWRGDQDQVGAYLHGYDSLWLPATLLQKDRQKQLADALFAASRHKHLELHINKGLAGAPPEALAATQQTATNPAVLGAFALVIIADGEAPAYPGQTRPEDGYGRGSGGFSRHRPGRGRIAKDCSERRLLCFGKQLLQPFVAGRVLGVELFPTSRHQGAIRSCRAVLCPSRRRQRGLER